MAVNPMLNSGVQGIRRGLLGLEHSAGRIAPALTATEIRRSGPRTASGDRSQAEALVALRLYKRQVQASAEVVEIADATIGLLLDKRS